MPDMIDMAKVRLHENMVTYMLFNNLSVSWHKAVVIHEPGNQPADPVKYFTSRVFTCLHR